MAKIKEFEISMVCYNLDNKYTLEQINDMFVDWTESKNIYAGGSIKPLLDEENLERDNTLSFLGWRDLQKKENRGGEVMYDIKGHHKWLTEGELFGYWKTRIK